MTVVVITGSTRGIGRGIAKELLKRGCTVVINGRNETSTSERVFELSNLFSNEKVSGFAGDMSDSKRVEELWDHAIKIHRKVDIWINNAGVMNEYQHTWELDPEQIDKIIDINLKGTIHGCRVALKGMQQQGFGHIYNLEGFGSNGKQFHPYMTPYGTTKAAVRYLTQSLAKEASESNVRIGSISPGIVVTDLLKGPFHDKPKEWESAKKIFNILADHVDTVAPFLANEILRNPKSGKNISWLTFGKVLGRFSSSLFKKRQLFLNETQTNS